MVGSGARKKRVRQQSSTFHRLHACILSAGRPTDNSCPVRLLIRNISARGAFIDLFVVVRDVTMNTGSIGRALERTRFDLPAWPGLSASIDLRVCFISAFAHQSTSSIDIGLPPSRTSPMSTVIMSVHYADVFAYLMWNLSPLLGLQLLSETRSFLNELMSSRLDRDLNCRTYTCSYPLRNFFLVVQFVQKFLVKAVR